MTPEMDRKGIWSYNGGRNQVERKGLLAELPAFAEAYQRFGGGNQNLRDRSEILDPLGWEQEVIVKFEASTENGPVSRRASFDGYKDGVLVEHESGEQRRANWHLMKMEAAYRDPAVMLDGRGVDAGIFLIPSYVSFPTLERTKNDVQAFLANYFDFSIPLFVWQYPSE